MRNLGLLAGVCLVLTLTCVAQVPKRVAVVISKGALAQRDPAMANGEERLRKAIQTKLTGQPSITIVDQVDNEGMSKVLEIQDLQNSGRYSKTTSARIGKLVGAEYVVIVEIPNATPNTRQENSPGSQKTISSLAIDADAKIVNLETGVVIANPQAHFDDSVVAVETKFIPIVRTTGKGVPAAFQNLMEQATSKLSDQLAKESQDALIHESAATAASEVPSDGPKVLGIDGDDVLLDRGGKAGIVKKARFQIYRIAATKLKNADGSVVMKREDICILNVTGLTESNASGKCVGGLPKEQDLAEPIE
jgi:Peptidoglycan-synthase activator LpoB